MKAEKLAILPKSSPNLNSCSKKISHCTAGLLNNDFGYKSNLPKVSFHWKWKYQQYLQGALERMGTWEHFHIKFWHNSHFYFYVIHFAVFTFDLEDFLQFFQYGLTKYTFGAPVTPIYSCSLERKKSSSILSLTNIFVWY